jgi:cell division septation protein DedD
LKPEPAAASITTAAAAPQEPVVVTPPPAAKKPKATAAAADAPSSLWDAEDAAPAKPAAAPKKTAAVATAAPAGAAPAPTGAGWVAVLLSVPASDKSRMDALKQFADMQQKYGSLLQNKTPDIQEANLGEKGTYHRLMVGPPGSREVASELCTQLKAQGYPSCWVTAY